MRKHSKTPLFLLELVLMLLIFSLSAVICLKVFASAYRISQDSSRMDAAMERAQAAAEYWKGNRGNLEKTASGLEGKLKGDGFDVFYDEAWEPVKNGTFRLEFRMDGAKGKIAVYEGEEQILEFFCEAVIYGE